MNIHSFVYFFYQIFEKLHECVFVTGPFFVNLTRGVVAFFSVSFSIKYSIICSISYSPMPSYLFLVIASVIPFVEQPFRG